MNVESLMNEGWMDERSMDDGNIYGLRMNGECMNDE
jgi:hypothetical protein